MVTRQDAIEYEKTLKSAFMKNQLAPLLRTISPDVKTVAYVSPYITGCAIYDEAVVIDFGDSEKCVNVSGDSYIAIVKDVLKKF